MRSVLVLVNPKAGLPRLFGLMRKAFDRFWDVRGTHLYYQFSQNQRDSVEKVRRAVREGVEIVLVVGGDGTVHSIGQVLVGTSVALGVVPAGSGNGFARHFGIPLAADRAIEVLAGAEIRTIDVGIANDKPFLVTCSMAWDASIVRSFEKMPIRGILPYVLAGAYELLDHKPQPIRVSIEPKEELFFPDPLVFTVANLTQYGGGAIIAPHARADDGKLELIVARREHLPHLVANLRRFFDGSLHKIPQIVSRSFRSLTVKRDRPTPIQMDGELVDAPAEFSVHVAPKALKVLVPPAPLRDAG